MRYDVLETPEGVRSRAVDAAVRADGRDLLLSGPALDAALRATTRPTSLLVAPAGMFGQEPGLLPAEAVAGYDVAVPALSACRPCPAPTTTPCCSRRQPPAASPRR